MLQTILLPQIPIKPIMSPWMTPTLQLQSITLSALEEDFIKGTESQNPQHYYFIAICTWLEI